MSGLSLYAGVRGTQAPQYGSASSYASGSSVTSSAFAGPSTNPTPTLGQSLAPTHGFGLAVWLGIGSIGLLALLRNSLPN
jgi:hypothetical protein